jgi:hypothetical protein
VDEKLSQIVESLQAGLTPEYVEAQVRALLRQGEDVGGGVNAFRLIKHWLGSLAASDVVVRQAYDQLKPALRAALEQVPSLYYFEGD